MQRPSSRPPPGPRTSPDAPTLVRPPERLPPERAPRPPRLPIDIRIEALVTPPPPQVTSPPALVTPPPASPVTASDGTPPPIESATLPSSALTAPRGTLIMRRPDAGDMLAIAADVHAPAGTPTASASASQVIVESRTVGGDWTAATTARAHRNPSEWHQLWLAVQTRRWSSLLMIPATGGLGDSLLSVAKALGEIGTEHLKQPIKVLDHRKVTLGQVESCIGALNNALAAGRRVLVVIDSIAENPAGVRFASTTDAAILCFALGRSSAAAAKKTIEAVGKERFLGSLALRPRSVPARQKPKKAD